jgi:sulfite exporter TauE/SafE
MNMTPLIISAFLMGILGSFHCAGMCGPLALSVPVKTESKVGKMMGALMYNIGRVFTYSLFGVIIGSFGKSMHFFGIQQWLSFIGGAVILIYFLSSRFVIKFRLKIFENFFEWVRSRLGKLFFNKTLFSVFIIGILNGLLPCGFVYLALAGAVVAGSIINSTLFMIFFGLGTLPMMWSIVFFGQYIPYSVLGKIKRVYPYMMMTIAFLLILRGLGLGIPYLSPKFEVKQAEVHSCCHKE